jgi:polyadenylate-binding protein
VKHLPPGFTDSQLYDLFRPYGALASVHAHTQFGPETGMVEFWSEDDARNAENDTHMRDIDGYTIAVQIYVPRRAPGGIDFNTAAPAFVPNSAILGPYTPQV